MKRLKRFIDAQDKSYRIAYREIKSGRKTSHWIWYIFPQLKGLGHSIISQRYGIDGIDEAREYMMHPILSLRLKNICFLLLSHSGKDIVDIMGRLDSLKVQACMTLFEIVCPNSVFSQVLDIFYEGKRHQKTLELLNYV